MRMMRFRTRTGKYNYGDNAITRSSVNMAGRAMKVAEKVGMKKR